MAAQAEDRNRARALDPAFKPVIVGVHWPSLPWGNESEEALLGDTDQDEFAAEQQIDAHELVELYAKRIADTDAARTGSEDNPGRGRRECRGWADGSGTAARG